MTISKRITDFTNGVIGGIALLGVPMLTLAYIADSRKTQEPIQKQIEQIVQEPQPQITAEPAQSLENKTLESQESLIQPLDRKPVKQSQPIPQIPPRRVIVQEDNRPQLVLTRDTYTDKSIIGELTLDKNKNGLRDAGEEHLAYTLELSYKENQNNRSSIPEGTYLITPRTSPKFGQHFLVNDVPGRDYILFHNGNYPKDTKGCILVGSKEGVDYVGNSRNTLAGLRNRFPSGFRVRIRRN